MTYNFDFGRVILGIVHYAYSTGLCPHANYTVSDLCKQEQGSKTVNSCSALTLQSVGPAHLPPSHILAVWPGAQGDPVPDVLLDP